jgi:hypothetical protein
VTPSLRSAKEGVYISNALLNGNGKPFQPRDLLHNILSWSSHNLPPALENLFETSSIASVHAMSLGHGEVFFVSYRGKDGKDHIRKSLLTNLTNEIYNG